MTITFKSKILSALDDDSIVIFTISDDRITRILFIMLCWKIIANDCLKNNSQEYSLFFFFVFVLKMTHPFLILILKKKNLE